MVFKPTGKHFDISDLDDVNLDQDPVQNFIDSRWEQVTKLTDDALREFLNAHGYRISKPYKIEEIIKIRDELAAKDLFLDYLYYTDMEYDEYNYKFIEHVLPFFNSISNPLKPDERNRLLESFKQVNRKETKDGEDM